MKIEYDNVFDCPHDSKVFQIFPDVHGDNRGYFTEVLKANQACNVPSWMIDNSWIKQINRSSSKGGIVRGFHAQFGKYCQGKFVEALTSKIYDIIIDARPDSKTFGMSNAYVLDPIVQNKLWVPRGFLHGFAVPKNESNAVFQYFCDNVFDKRSETGINPKTFIFKFIELIKANKTENDNTYDDLFDLFENDITLSDKDCNAEDYSSWMQKQKTDYDKFGKIWYVE